jgi:AcrR family transcriptional regulator
MDQGSAAQLSAAPLGTAALNTAELGTAALNTAEGRTGRSSTSRDERRRDTQDRILRAARLLFAERGYDQTTIRAIATEAATDPALVMRYFRSKAALFADATSAPGEAPAQSPPDVVGSLLAILTGKLEREPTATLAMLKSMLTHEQAGDDVRILIGAHESRVRAAITADHVELRASLISALCLGTVIGRYLLDLDGLRDAALADITEVLAPCLDLLAHGPASA